jgi:hypothetical protein
MSRRERLGGIRRPAALRADQPRRKRQKGGTVRRFALLAAAVASLAASLALAITFGGTAAASPQQDAGKVVFFSNQLTQVSEVQAVRDTLLKGFNGDAEFIPTPVGQPQVFFDRVEAEARAGREPASPRS